MDVSENLLLRSSDQTGILYLNLSLIGGFLIALPLGGLKSWIVAFKSQPRGRRDFKEKCLRSPLQSDLCGIHTVYRALATLLIVGLFNGITSIVLGSAMLWYCQSGDICTVASNVFYISRSYGIILHLLVAVGSIFHLCHPTQGTHHRYFLAAYYLMIVVISPTYVYASYVAFILLAIVIIGLALTIVIKSLTPVATPSFAKQKKLIVLVAMITFWVIFFPSFVLECLIRYDGNLDHFVTYVNALFYTSFNIIMDGVLCSLILSLSSGEQEQEQQPPPQWQQPPPQWQQPPPQWQQPPPQWQQPPPQWQQPPPQGQQPPPQWQQPPSQGQQPPPQGQQPPPQWQQPPPQGQQPPPQWQHGNGVENSGFST